MPMRMVPGLWRRPEQETLQQAGARESAAIGEDRKAA